MSIADIVIIAVVAVMALIGLWKGFFKTLISFCGWFVSVLIAVLTARVVAEALLDISAVGNFVAGSGDGFSLFTWFKNILPDELMSLPAGANSAEIEAAIGSGAVGALLKPFIGVLTGDAIAASATTVGEGIALGLAGGLFEVMVGLAMFIVVRIIMTLFVMFAKSHLSTDKKKGVLGRLGGFLFGAVRGALYCAVLLAVVGFVTPFGFMESVTNEIDKGVLSKPIASQVYTLSGRISSNENYFNKLLKISGVGEKEDEGGDTATAEETAVKEFFDAALESENGLFSGTVIGGEGRDRYNNIISSLNGKFNEAAQIVAAGNVSDRSEEMKTLAAEVKAGTDEAPAGRIYTVTASLVSHLDAYIASEDEQEAEALELDIEQDLANLKFLLNEETAFGTMFGTVTIENLRAEPNIEPSRPVDPDEEGNEGEDPTDPNNPSGGNEGEDPSDPSGGNEGEDPSDPSGGNEGEDPSDPTDPNGGNEGGEESRE